MMKPLFSIITVTYNAARTLPTTLRSIRSQSFRDFEHIIVDGASTDSTLAIARKQRGTSDTIIISEPDKGLYDAMNKGMDMARGTYLIFLNSGDTFHASDTLERIARAISENGNPGIVYGQTQIVDSSGNRLADRHLTAPASLTYSSFADGMVVCHQAFVVLACVASPFNLRYRFSADYEWCIRCLQHSRNNVYVGAVTVDYLNEGITTRNHGRSLIERFIIMRRYYGTVPTIIRHARFIPRYLRRRKIEKKFNTIPK